MKYYMAETKVTLKNRVVAEKKVVFQALTQQDAAWAAQDLSFEAAEPYEHLYVGHAIGIEADKLREMYYKDAPTTILKKITKKKYEQAKAEGIENYNEKNIYEQLAEIPFID